MLSAPKGLHGPAMISFGRGGDSGSAITTEIGEFVGLCFAGNDDSTRKGQGIL